MTRLSHGVGLIDLFIDHVDPRHTSRGPEKIRLVLRPFHSRFGLIDAYDYVQRMLEVDGESFVDGDLRRNEIKQRTRRTIHLVVS